MKHLDLFSGIGGFALATEMVWDDVEHVFVEYDPFCQEILKKHWPNSSIYGDIKQFDGRKFEGVDLLTGGFPCQPFSSAGQKRGTKDDRHLWPEMARIIGECQPKWVIAENVAGLLAWNGGVVFEQIQSDLEHEGYDVENFVLPACSVNAPHRRDRVWIIATNTEHNGLTPSEIRRSLGKGDDNHAERKESGEQPQGLCRAQHGGWETWPARPYVRGMDDGLPNRVDRIKSLGNAIVPQVAAEIMRAMITT